MRQLSYSFIIPVYNRPNEIKELLSSFLNLKGNFLYEIVIIEDGSKLSSKEVVDSYKNQLNITYLFKANSGPGDSRNYGMQRAKGNYFIILDSDVILPENYLYSINESLNLNFFDCFGGPDAAHPSFSNLQKAISFSMTSFITTGGIRGGKRQIENFQPRSFNMGLSQQAFLKSGGFGKIHPGEDPDLSLRLHKLGFKTTLIQNACVFHKRRISWTKFYEQVNKFGKVRPILNKWHPNSKSIVYWFPTAFCFGFIIAILLCFFQIKWPFYFYILYVFIAFILALFTYKNLVVAFKAIIAIIIQFSGYGIGFFMSVIMLKLLRKEPEEAYPELFF